MPYRLKPGSGLLLRYSRSLLARADGVVHLHVCLAAPPVPADVGLHRSGCPRLPPLLARFLSRAGAPSIQPERERERDRAELRMAKALFFVIPRASNRVCRHMQADEKSAMQSIYTSHGIYGIAVMPASTSLQRTTKSHQILPGQVNYVAYRKSPDQNSSASPTGGPLSWNSISCH